jgi:hypothetical protein
MRSTNEYADLDKYDGDLDNKTRELFKTKGAVSFGEHRLGPGVMALLSPDGKQMMIMPGISEEEMEMLRQGLHIIKAEPNLEGEELEANIVAYMMFWYDLYIEHSGLYMEPTFTYLEQRYGRPTFGGQDLSYSEADNVILWTGISQALGQAIINLTTKGEIHWHPTTAIQYDIQGRALPLPLASLPIDTEYTTPHWLPVAFRLGRNCGDHFCPNREQWMREQK